MTHTHLAVHMVLIENVIHRSRPPSWGHSCAHWNYFWQRTGFSMASVTSLWLHSPIHKCISSCDALVCSDASMIVTSINICHRTIGLLWDRTTTLTQAHWSFLGPLDTENTPQTLLFCICMLWSCCPVWSILCPLFLLPSCQRQELTVDLLPSISHTWIGQTSSALSTSSICGFNVYSK